MSLIPVTIIITAKNEERNLAACLEPLTAFDEIIVVDSSSRDRTQKIAEKHGALVHDFKWSGQYPKKRQWVLENIPTKYDRIFFVDADEIVTPLLIAEIAALEWTKAGYFVQGQYRFDGRLLEHGLRNNKLVLFDKTKVEFPVVNDLDIGGMGEMEGHYQPVLKQAFQYLPLGQLENAMIHNAFEDAQKWQARHERYAMWEAGMNAHEAWPRDPVPKREKMKQHFRKFPRRDVVAFLYSFVWKRGFLDGNAGFKFAQMRARYYRMISDASTEKVPSSSISIGKPERQL